MKWVNDWTENTPKRLDDMHSEMSQFSFASSYLCYKSNQGCIKPMKSWYGIVSHHAGCKVTKWFSPLVLALPTVKQRLQNLLEILNLNLIHETFCKGGLIGCSTEPNLISTSNTKLRYSTSEIGLTHAMQSKLHFTTHFPRIWWLRGIPKQFSFLKWNIIFSDILFFNNTPHMKVDIPGSCWVHLQPAPAQPCKAWHNHSGIQLSLSPETHCTWAQPEIIKYPPFQVPVNDEEKSNVWCQCIFTQLKHQTFHDKCYSMQLQEDVSM